MNIIRDDVFMTNNRCILLAYDQGLEHGPTDFDEANFDPKYILDIAKKGRYDGIILHHGTAEKYYGSHYHSVPLIIKLNGKTKLLNGDPISRQLCSVERAIKIGAQGVGYTIYPGSLHEEEMLVELSHIVEKSHEYGLPVFVWTYPRGTGIEDEYDTDTLAYSARMAAELGADFIKIKYNGLASNFRWVVKNACKAKIVISGGDKVSEAEFLDTVSEFMGTGAVGLAVGRNIWQHPEPYDLSAKLRQCVESSGRD